METRHRILRSVLAGLHATRMDRLFAALDDARGAIITLHHVREERRRSFAPNAHLSVTPEFFDATLTDLRTRGVDVISMDELPDRLRARRPGRFVAITFDDGYRDNYENARPVLDAHGAPYTIYVTSGFLKRTAFLWWEAAEALVRRCDGLEIERDGAWIALDCSTFDAKVAAYEALIVHFKTSVPEPDVVSVMQNLCQRYEVDVAQISDRQIMTLEQVQTLAADPLCTLGAHTATHRSLARLPFSEAKLEIERGTDELAEITGVRPRHFAYPYGFPAAAGAREFALVRELGFETGVTTRRGVLYGAHADHLTGLPRISINGYYQNKRFVRPLLSGLPTRLARGGRRLDVA